MPITLKQNMTILFQGDSITDCGCREPNIQGLGRGYVYLTAAQLLARYPQLNLTIVNRGISGNRVIDLAGRWDKDCLALKPDVLSIMIGINDTWRAFDSNDPTSTESYYTTYHSLLKKTVDKLGGIQLIICEPFLLPYPDDRKAWRKDLDPKITAARSLAAEFKALYVPLDGIFAAAAIQKNCAYWTMDGVHPTDAGHALIANSWMNTVIGD